jgi:excisionase family DNA binding protein
MPQIKGKPSAKANSGSNEVLTLAEAASYLRVPEKQLRDIVDRGEFPGRKIGAEWRFFKPALQAWLGTSPRKRNGILAHIGAGKDDPYLEEMLQGIYQRRQQSEAQESE